tara:strand:- start:4358 stop:5476 length:1119 start_codon:yes stop_codon:yes gene_type:complete
MATGTPIRLVREDGGLISLNATQIALSTEREFGPNSMPFAGSQRLALDLNINKAIIRIDGFFSDDTQATGAAAAEAKINFNVNTQNQSFVSSNNLGAWYSSFGSTTNNITLQSTNGTISTITLTKDTDVTTNYNTSTNVLKINTTSTTATQLATAVSQAINDQHSSLYTASLYDALDKDGNSQTDSGVLIKQVTNGKAGNSKSTPTFSNSGYNFYPPKIESFSGGRDAEQKSAGDKAQDLYSIVNNSSRTLRKVALEDISTYYNELFDFEFIPDIISGGSGSDYIVGIQIPYNSKIEAGNNEYTAKNFFMPTGFYNKNEKDSTNAKPAGVEFDESNDFTGIQGGISSMDIIYDAGEAIYNYTMTFLPADAML